jgi:hypothetical protein
VVKLLLLSFKAYEDSVDIQEAFSTLKHAVEEIADACEYVNLPFLMAAMGK